jgi:hypothetical protein
MSVRREFHLNQLIEAINQDADALTRYASDFYKSSHVCVGFPNPERPYETEILKRMCVNM